MSAAKQPRAPRLLCVYQHAPTPGAPGIYRHRLLFAELVRRGWQVDLVSTPLNYMTGNVPTRYARRLYTRESLDGIVHHWVWASRSIHASKLRRALNYVTFAFSSSLRAITLRRPDVVLVSSPPLTVGALGPVLATRFRRPWVFEVRDAWPESAASVGWLSEQSLLYRVLERVAHRLASRAQAVIVPTPGLIEIVRRHGAKKVDVISGAVIDAPSSPELRRAARARLGVPDDECLFLYLGALGAANGVDTLLDAVQALPTDTPARFLLVGDGSARVALEERVREQGIETVSIVPAVPKDEVKDYLAASDVCLHLLRADPVRASDQGAGVLRGAPTFHHDGRGASRAACARGRRRLRAGRRRVDRRAGTLDSNAGRRKASARRAKLRGWFATLRSRGHGLGPGSRAPVGLEIAAVSSVSQMRARARPDRAVTCACARADR